MGNHYTWEVFKDDESLGEVDLYPDLIRYLATLRNLEGVTVKRSSEYGEKVYDAVELAGR